MIAYGHLLLLDHCKAQKRSVITFPCMHLHARVLLGLVPGCSVTACDHAEAQAQSSPTRKPGSRLRHSTQQQQQQQESADLADSDADSAHQPDLSIAVPDASSMRAGSARLAQRRASHRPAPDESATLAPQSNNSKPKPVGGRRDKAITAHRQDVSCSQSGQEDAVAGSEVHQTASDGTVQSTEAEQELAPVRTGQKRKRQPPRAIQQQHAVAAVPVQSTRRIKGPELSTLMPLQSRKANPQARHTPRQPAAHADQAVDADASNSLRRTGRQRKLTAAAAAAVEEFPSLYRQPRHPPAKGGQSPAADSVGTSEDASAEAPASSSQKAKHGPAKRSRVQESPALPGINHVQMRQLVRHGVIPAGTHEFLFDSKQPCEVEVLPDGKEISCPDAALADAAA